MLEFLKKCVNTSVYERAMDCELNLRAYNSLVPMQTFFEIMLKTIFQDYMHITYNSDYVTLGEMLNDSNFTREVKKIVPSYNSAAVRRLSSDAANPGKHSVDMTRKASAEMIKTSFRMVFDFASDYYSSKTHEARVEWSDEEYELCLNKIDPNAREKYGSLINTLEEQLEEALENRKSSQTEIDEIKENLKAAKEKCYTAETELEKLHRMYQTVEIPSCPRCGQHMVLRTNRTTGEHFWGCSQYPNCRATATYTGGLSHFEADSNALSKFKRDGLEFATDPLYLEEQNPISYIFQSLTIPKELFKNREKLKLIDFSRFMMMTSRATKSVTEENRTLFSLVLRLLNRGVLLPIDDDSEEKLKALFNTTESGNINIYKTATKYNRPYNAYDSEREKMFAEKYFPALLGESWGNYVIPQMSLELLLPDEDFENQRIDFYVNHMGSKVIIELDGSEHQQKIEQDSWRNAALENAGYRVIRFTNAQVDSDATIIMRELSSALSNEIDYSKDVNVDCRYIIATKLLHQFSIAIIKSLEQGFIPTTANLSFNASTELFDSKEIDTIGRIAVSNTTKLLYSFAAIYDVNLDLNLFNKSAEKVNVDFGDGLSENSIIVRDCSLSKNYMCRIAPFGLKVMPKNMNADALKNILYYIFSFKDFRPGQMTAIERLLFRKDSIVLLPTGAGKSIIYQFASFIVPGIILVISPLRSLIKDQVDNLEYRNGINCAIPIYSSVDKAERNKIELNKIKMRHNSTTLIYAAPERMLIPSFVENINILMSNNNVYGVAIDEAHCVSEWGHEFRSAYLNIGNSVRKMFRKADFIPTIVALTGTASEAVLNDVKRDLNIKADEAIVRPGTFDRNELVFSLSTCESSNKTNMICSSIKNMLPEYFDSDFDEFYRLDGSNTNSGIVFTPNAASKKPGCYDALSVQKDITSALPELRTGCYFSKTPENYDDVTWAATVSEFATRFKEDELNLLVATKAYGMGIDKANIRFIIHDGIPSSFEQYYQEAGRAGRDGKLSNCSIIFSDNNPEFNDQLLNPSLSLDEFRDMYRSSNTNDDLNKIIFFHLESFKGIEGEIDFIKDFVDEISGCDYTASEVIRVARPKYAIDNKLKALMRLRLLGVLDNYFYDYNGNYKLLFGSIDKDSITDHYLDYIKTFGEARAKAESRKLSSFNGNDWSYVMFVAKALITFVYENIESERRTCIRNMYQVAKEASTLSLDEQNDYFHKYTDNYFTTSDTLQFVYDSSGDGIKETDAVITINKDCVNESEEEREKAANMLPGIGRLRESKAHHPGLLFLEAISLIKSGNYKKQTVIDDVVSALQFAEDEYASNREDVDIHLPKLFNLMMNSSIELFNDSVDEIVEKTNRDKNTIIESMVFSGDVSDQNRDYLLLDYSMSMLKKEV